MNLTLRRLVSLVWRASWYSPPSFVGVLVTTLPDAPWTWLQYGGPALMIVFPVFFYPFSKTLFLAFDLIFRPPTAQDFDNSHGE